LTAAACTSFYMWRSYYLTFEGEHAKPEIATEVHESPPAITYVLAVLAFLAATAGVAFGFSTHLVGREGEPLLEQWLHPVLRHARGSFKASRLILEYLFMALSVWLALVSWRAARHRYGTGRARNWAEREQTLPLFEAIQNKYWVDEIYQATI